MSKQDVSVELYYGGAWHDVVSDDDVLVSPPIKISHGGGEEGAAPRPNRTTLSLANDDDKYRPSNPMSPLYGLAGRNTPCRVSVGGTVRGIGEASFESDQTDAFRRYPKRGKAWVDVDAAGLLQRIGQWTEPLKSAFRVFNDGLSSVLGYWPMEDAAGSVVATSPISGARNVTLRGHSFGSQNSPPGGGTAVDVGSNPFASFLFASSGTSITDGWQLSKLVYIDRFTGGGASDVVTQLNTYDGSVFELLVNGDTGNLHLYVNNGTTAVVDLNFSSSYQWTGRWIMLQLQASYSGGTTTVGASWRAVDDSTFIGVSGTYAGVPGIPYYTAPWLLSGSSYGHVMAVRGFTDDLTSDARFDAFLGHPGELASVRFGRLCDQQGVPYYVSDGYLGSQAMGPQRVDTFPNHLKEIAATDDALIYDHGSELRLFMLCGPDRLNQTPSLTLNALSDTDLASPPKEVLNDLDPHNIVTAKQREGGDYTAEDSTSSMGTQSPPNGIGEYKQTVDVNVADEAERLPQVARWWLAKGTLDRPRFPTVTVNLAAAPDLIPAVEATDTGSVIEIVNYREYTIRLHVLGWTETVGTHGRVVTFTCALDDVFKTGRLNSARLQAKSTFMYTGLGPADTTLTFYTSEPYEQWRPGVSGLHVLIGGEEIILGTISARTGTNPWFWTITGCTRSANGVAKTHPLGEQVLVTDAIRLTL